MKQTTLLQNFKRVSMPKHFVTIFEKSENIHLIKDVGQIPYHMHKQFGYTSTLVTYKNNKEYPYLQEEVKGLNIKFIPKIKLLSYSLSIIWYLIKHAKSIDVLHLHHHRNKTYLHIIIYKKLNPQGIAYLKSDMGYKSVIEHDGFIPKKRPKFWLREKLFNMAKQYVDIIGIETVNSFEFLVNRYPELKEKLLYMTNGLDLERLYSLSSPLEHEQKEKWIITVGRIGAKEKNNTMLLNALAMLELKEWKIFFIGPIEDSFAKEVERFYKKHPHLQQNIILTGSITDRKKLMDFYAKSSVFCLTSVEESFGFVLIEALAYDNYLITTDISSAADITDNQKYGTIINSSEHLVQTLTQIINKGISQKSIDYTKTKYDWHNIVKILEKRIDTIKCI